MAREISTMAVSWKASLPITACGTCPVMATTGTLSSFASARAVTRFVAPGPLVAMHTPTSPVTRATPWAANPPPCSCRGRMVRRSSDAASSAWCSGMLAPPG